MQKYGTYNYTIIGVVLLCMAQSIAASNLDVMQDFSYPISDMQQIRYDITQAVYALQHKNYDAAISYTQAAADSSAHFKINDLHNQEHDDHHRFIQHMINTMYDLLNEYEQGQEDHHQSERLVLHDLCQNILNSI